MVNIGDITIQGQADMLVDGVSAFTQGTNLTRDISLASGTQVITGLDFKPTYIRFQGVVNGVGTAGFWGGYSTGVGTNKNRCTSHNHNETADTTQSNSSCIRVVISSGNEYSGTVTSFNSDGFTITWTKTGLPTGTLTVAFQAFKI